MYNRHLKRARRKSKKPIMLMVSVLLILAATCGMTLAYLSTRSDSVENIFTLSKITTEVDESFENEVKSNVKIKNTGDATAYIRAAVVITWQDEDGNVYGQAPVENVDYTISYNLGNGWLKAADGLYYWTSPVKSQAEDSEDCFTGVLITECKAKETAPADYYLSVEIIGSAIQSTPTNVVTENWSSGVSGVNGTTLQIKQSGN